MHRRDLPIHTPCGADWAAMSPAEARARLCAQCNKVVYDVSAMSEREVRARVEGGPACVRYLYDVHGRILFGGAPEGAMVVPAASLLSKVTRSKWLAAAALVAVPMVFEACGSTEGSYGDDRTLDAGGSASDDAGARLVPAHPGVRDGGDAGDAGDAADPNDAGPDADDPDAG